HPHATPFPYTTLFRSKEMSRFVDLRSLGAVVCKTVTPEPRLGISPPRGAETASGMLNAIGLQNPGVAAFREGDLVWLAERNVPRSEEHTSELQSRENL